ncbi:AAEL012898-PA [Aedes aegypti]|uniref:AAEL012896-PA n=2 Tax=Aedes aegypti TaxID=7159 RepID=Q16KR7_AEDAE|nr:zinc finger HIT domain-containing protein 1 [Aedes aegypti]EAT34901.1 AAEL012896-PA [Aedes aegypti]EAT34904.1 AAEL012898-PA [Aedes aegypti]
MASRESGRIREADKKRVLDDASRKRRARKALEALEQDNYHEDPHADLVMSKKIPKFQDNMDGVSSSNTKKKAKRSKGAEYYRAKYRKNFPQLLEEDKMQRPDGPNYFTAAAQPSKLPERHFCAVCGFPSSYTCTACGTRYCSVRCLGTHQDTRCLKWTA